jgi:outer membrane receptor protein involved in Fe transport
MHTPPQPSGLRTNVRLHQHLRSTRILGLVAAIATAHLSPLAAQQGAPPPSSPNRDEDEVITLSPFSVQAHSDIGYGASAVGSSGRLRQPYLDSAQVTSVVTSELMEDMGLADSAAAMMFVPNLSVWRTADLQSFTIRGIGTNNIFMDGFFSNRLVFIDTAFTDRIEVVKGPSSTAFGRGDPAGFINYVSKRPLFKRSTRTTAEYGTGGVQDNYRLVLDHSGFLGSGRNTAYRFVAQWARGSNTRIGSEFERTGALLAVDHRFKRGGDLQVTAHYYQNDSGGAVGNLSFSDATLQYAFRSSIVNSPVVPLMSNDFTFNYTGSSNEVDYASLKAVLNFPLGQHWNMRQAFHYHDTQRLSFGTAGNVASVRSGPNGLLVTITPNRGDNTERGWAYQADFLYERKSAFLNSKFSALFGGDASDTVTGAASQGAVGTPPQLYLNFDPDIPKTWPTTPLSATGTETSGLIWSPYVQLQGTLFDDKLQATAAARYIYFEQEGLSRVTGAVTDIKYRTPLLPTVSLLYKPVKWMSIYGLFSRYQDRPTFRQQYTGVGGVQLPANDPRVGTTITIKPSTELNELGIKGSLLNDKLSFSLAVFKVKNTGVGRFATLPDPVVGSVIYNFTSEDEVTGWEVELHGRPTRRLTLMAGAGFTGSHANVPAPGGQIVDLAYSGNPDTIHANIKYSFGAGDREGLTVMGGAKTYLSGWSANVNSVAALGNLPYPDTVTVANLSGRYGFRGGRDSLSLRVNNAFHKGAKVAGSYVGAVGGRQVFLTYDRQF